MDESAVERHAGYKEAKSTASGSSFMSVGPNDSHDSKSSVRQAGGLFGEGRESRRGGGGVASGGGRGGGLRQGTLESFRMASDLSGDKKRQKIEGGSTLSGSGENEDSWWEQHGDDLSSLLQDVEGGRR